MPANPFWTPEADADLRRRYCLYTNAELAMHFNRSIDAVKQRAINLGITENAIATDADDGKVEARYGDHAFIKAMAAAIRAGRERPPRVGIDTRPSTKAPRFVDKRQMLIVRSSNMADV